MFLVDKVFPKAAMKRKINFQIDEAAEWARKNTFVNEVENPVKEAAAMVKKETAMSLEEINKEVLRLEEIHGQMTSMEGEAKAAIWQQVYTLRASRRDAKWPRLDMSFMKWRNKDGWPIFAFFHPEGNGTCQISATLNEYGDFQEQCKPALFNYCNYGLFTDVVRRLQGMIPKGTLPEYHYYEQAIEAKFEGTIPQKIRDRLIEIKNSEEFESIRIITEAPKWSVEGKVKRINPDPLIIGVHGDKAWLLDSFDITPLEHVIRSEFTTSPKS